MTYATLNFKKTMCSNYLNLRYCDLEFIEVVWIPCKKVDIKVIINIIKVCLVYKERSDKNKKNAS